MAKIQSVDAVIQREISQSIKKLKKFLKKFLKGTDEASALHYLEKEDETRFYFRVTKWIKEMISEKIENKQFSKKKKFDLIRYLFAFKNAKPKELEALFLKVYQRLSGEKPKDPFTEDLKKEFDEMGKGNIS